MSTATAPERSHAPYAEPDEYIDYQLRKTQTGIKRIDMLTAAIVAITVLIGYVLLFVLSDHWLFEGGVGGTARMLMFLPVIGFVGWLIGAKVIWPALRTVSGLYAARTLEASSTEFRSSLLNLVDLKQAGREVSPLIMATIEKRAAVTLAKFNVDDAIDKRPLLRTLYVLFGIVVAFCAYSVLCITYSWKPLGPSVLRAMIPFTNVAPGTQTEIVSIEVIAGGKTLKAEDAVRIRAGDSVDFKVQLRGEPAEPSLLYTTSDRRFVDEPEAFRPTNDKWEFELTHGNTEQGLLQSFTYHVRAGDTRSPEYRVEIIMPPSATATEVRYDYPEYTELDPRTQMGGAIDVWERTVVTITAVANVPVRDADFEVAEVEDFSSLYRPATVKKSQDGKKLTIQWTANAHPDNGKFPKFYRIKVKDDEGNPDPKPAVYPINIRVDQPPQIVLIDPTTNLKLPANGTIPLVVAARDQDFKLRTVSLKIARDENDVTDETLFDGSQQEIALKHDFQLEPLRLKEGDKIRIWVEAQDNRLPTHNLAKTPPIEITIKDKVSKEEAKKQLAEQKQEQQQRIDEANKKNNDQASDPNEQPSDPANSPDQPPRDPNEPEPPKDKGDEANKEPPPKGQQQDDKNSKGQNGGSGKTQKGGEGKKTETGSEGKSDKPGEKGNAADGKSSKPSLKSDGTQDQEALEQIARRDEQKHGRRPKKSEQQSSPSSAQREPQENTTGESADKPMPNGSSKTNPQDDPKANDGNKPSQTNRGQQPKTDKNDNAGPKSATDPDNSQPGDKSNAAEKGTPPKEGDDSKNPDGSKDPKGKSPREGDEPKPGEKNSTNPDGKGKEQSGNDPKSPNKPNGQEGNDQNADGGKKPMPNKAPGDKNDSSKAEDNSGEKPNSKPDGQKSGSNDKPSNDPKQPSDGGKSDGQKPKGLGKPETDDKQRSPDGAKSDKPSEDGKSSDSKDDKAGNEKPDSKKPNDPAGKGTDDKAANAPDKQASSDKTDGSKPGDKGSEKADSSKKPRRGNQGDKSNDKGNDNQASDKPGDDKSGQPKDGGKSDSGQPKKDGSQKSDQGGQKPGEQSGKKSSNKDGGGKPSDSDSDSQATGKPGGQGKSSGKAGSAPGNGSLSSSGTPNAPNSSSGSGSSSGAPEEANEEFTKEAANLVLKRLQKDIERGEIDQELLDELGWNEEQMKKFVERMQQQLEAKPEDDDSPQAKARRRQFEEMLKNLDLTEKTQRRDDTNKEKQTGDGIGPVRRPPPPEYRESFESFTKGLSKKKAGDSSKK